MIRILQKIIEKKLSIKPLVFEVFHEHRILKFFWTYWILMVQLFVDSEKN